MRIGGIVLCGGRSSRMGAPKAWLPFGGELMLPRVVRVLSAAVDPVVVVAAPGQDVPPLPEGVVIVRDDVEGRGPLGGLAAGLAALEGAADAVYLSSCDVPLLTPAFVARVVSTTAQVLPKPFAGLGLRLGSLGGLETDPNSNYPCFRPLPRGGSANRSRNPRCSVSHLSGGRKPPVPGNTQAAYAPRSEVLAAVPFIGDRLHPLAAAYRVEVLPVVREMLAANRLRLMDLFDLVPTRVIEAPELADADPDLLSLRNVNTPEEYEAALKSLS